MSWRCEIADTLIRLAYRIDSHRIVVVDHPGGDWEVRAAGMPMVRIQPGVARNPRTGEEYRVAAPAGSLRERGAVSTTMWTKLNSSSGKFVRGGPRVPWRSRR